MNNSIINQVYNLTSPQELERDIQERMKKDIKVVLWNAANALRAQMDAAEYKHIVLGLVFLKYLSDAFISQQKKIRNTVSDSDKQQTVLENRDYYLQDSMFGVPKDARWENLQAQAKQSDTGTRIDDAMAIIERAPPQLKGKLNKCFGQTQLEQGILGELIDLISNNIKLGGGMILEPRITMRIAVHSMRHSER